MDENKAGPTWLQFWIIGVLAMMFSGMAAYYFFMPVEHQETMTSNTALRERNKLMADALVTCDMKMGSVGRYCESVKSFCEFNNVTQEQITEAFQRGEIEA